MKKIVSIKRLFILLLLFGAHATVYSAEERAMEYDEDSAGDKNGIINNSKIFYDEYLSADQDWFRYQFDFFVIVPTSFGAQSDFFDQIKNTNKIKDAYQFNSQFLFSYFPVENFGISFGYQEFVAISNEGEKCSKELKYDFFSNTSSKDCEYINKKKYMREQSFPVLLNLRYLFYDVGKNSGEKANFSFYVQYGFLFSRIELASNYNQYYFLKNEYYKNVKLKNQYALNPLLNFGVDIIVMRHFVLGFGGSLSYRNAETVAGEPFNRFDISFLMKLGIGL